MGRLKILFALGSLALPVLGLGQSAPASPSPEIEGIALGMSPDEVRAILKARKGPMREYQAMLSYTDNSSQLPVHIPDSLFLNAIVQTTKRGDPAEKLTVFFSPTPGQERVVAVTRHKSYPRTTEVRESELRDSLAEISGEVPPAPEASQESTQFWQAWSLPAQKNENVERCRFNLTQESAATDPKSGWVPQNYVIANHDLLLDLIDNKCGPNVIDVHWKTREPKLTPDQRVLEHDTVAIVSLELAQESIDLASKMIATMHERTHEQTVQSASARPASERR